MLKDTQIKALKPKDKTYLVSDGNGLSIVINPNGSKKWRFRYYFEKKAKTLSLGSYPEIGIATARKKLLEAREKVANGINPSNEKKIIADEKVKTNALTFSKIADEYLVSREGNVSTHHYERSESLIRLYAKPKLGTYPIYDLTHKDIKALIVSLADMDKKASAQKLFGVVKQILDYAELKDYVEVNVCNLLNVSSLIKDYHPQKLSTITKPDEIKQLMKNIENYTGHYTTKKAMQFMALTSLRSANVRGAKWDQIDFKNKIMTIPKEQMKIEKKRLADAEDFKLPLSTQAMLLLDDIKPLSGHGIYIFPSIRGDKAMSENALLVMVRGMDYTKDQFTPHGFRAMFATIANQEGDFNLELIDAQLAHKVGGSVSQSYNRTNYLEKRRVLVQWWGDWLNGIKR